MVRATFHDRTAPSPRPGLISGFADSPRAVDPARLLVLFIASTLFLGLIALVPIVLAA